MHVMTTALAEGEGTTPYRLQVQNVYTDLRDGSNIVLVVIKNTTGKAVILNKGVAFAKVVAANEIPTLHLKPGKMEALDDMQGIDRPRMSISEWRRKLIKKLDLSGLKAWPSELATEHTISLTDLDPYKERFCKLPSPMLDEVWNTLKDMLDSGTIRPSQSPWCNVVVLVRKKDGNLYFCIDFQRLNNCSKKDSFPLP